MSVGNRWSRGGVLGTVCVALLVIASPVRAQTPGGTYLIQGHGTFEYVANSAASITMGGGGGFTWANRHAVFNGALELFSNSGKMTSVANYSVGYGWGPYLTAKSGEFKGGSSVNIGVWMPSGGNNTNMTVSLTGWSGGKIAFVGGVGYILPKNGGTGEMFLKTGLGLHIR